MRSSAASRIPNQQPPSSDDQNPSIAALLLKSLRRPGTDEVDELSSYFDQRTNIQKEYVDTWFELQDSTFSKYEKYKADFNDLRHKANANTTKFLQNVEGSSLLRRDFVLDIESELKGPEHEDLVASEWFQHFKRHQSSQFVKLLHEIAKKVISSRFTKVQQEQRKELEETIEKQIKAIDKCRNGRTGDKINPYFKHHLSDLALSINELQRIDNIIPKILKDLQARPKEYVKEIVPAFKEFSAKMIKVYKDFEDNTFKDAGNRVHYTNIDKEEPDRIRASRYGLNIANRDLGTLRTGRLVHPLVVTFFLQFLKEKTQQINVKLGENERVYLYDSIVDVYRGDAILLDEFGKEGSNIWRYYKRLGFIIGVDDRHIIFVELRKTDDDLKKELVIYNSDVEKYQMFHRKIYEIFRNSLGLDEPEVMMNSLAFRPRDSREAFGASMRMKMQTKNSVGHVLDLRVANCPQQVNPFDSAVYASKNASLLCLNKKIMQGMYSQADINQFRYEIFNIILKIGNDADVDIYDIEA